MSTTSTSTFASLGLSAAMLRDIAEAGFLEPTPIQAQAIPAGVQGRDVLGCAQTGTGKTAAFIIPMIERLADAAKGPPRGLVLAPTRELELQIQVTIDQLGRGRRVFATTIIGGSDMQAQVRGLRQRPDIVVATPGRLLDHMWNGTLLMASLQIVVLDEADRMLDMGFAPQLNQILDALPEQRQTLLFSATWPADLADLARVSVQNPVRVMVDKPATPVAGVTQTVHQTTPQEKTRLLLSLLKGHAESVLVCTRTKHRADRLGEALTRDGHRVAVLHGNRGLSQRRRALESFRRGSVRILVATDIAARGLDVANIGHVINYDLPNCPEDYVHRIGRTARMKAVGQATSFVTTEDHHQIRAIERLLGGTVPRASGSSLRSTPRSEHAEGRAKPHAGHGSHFPEYSPRGRAQRNRRGSGPHTSDR